MIMFPEVQLSICNKDCFCVNCDSTTCLRAGDIGADCPKYHCDNQMDCENCEFIKNLVNTKK